MKLLAGKVYDPAAAVTKATSALLAMTAFDTTNLRVAFTAPASGIVRWRLVCVVHGATTLPSVLLGVLESTTVRARLAPMVGGGNLIATGRYQLEATGLITGLTGGNAYTFDAAYGVEVVVASTGIKYGGPNNATTNDAFGGIVFEVWDIDTAAGGGGSGASAQEVWEYATRSLTDKAGFGLADGAITAAKLAAAALNGKGDWNIGKTGYSLTQSFPTNFASLAITAGGAVTAGTVSDKTGYALSTAPPTAAAIRTEMDANSTKLANLDATVSSRLAAAGYTAPDNANIAAAKAVMDKLDTALEADAAVYRFTTNALEQAPVGEGGGGTAPTVEEIRAELDANSTKLANLDAAISSRLATSGYTAPPSAATNASAVRSELTTELGRLDAAVSTRMATFTYTAPDNAGIAAVQAKTDLMSFNGTCLRANMCRINDTLLTGDGTAGNKWRALGT